jgi:molybdenum cofactor cytidylyltransferase
MTGKPLDIERTTLVLLAAGQSTRFGHADKLDEEFLGRPLGLHVTVALESMPFAERVAVVDSCRIDYGAHGFRVIANDRATEGMASSLKLGIACAKATGADAVLVALADMPRVTAAHVYRLFDASAGSGSVVASSDGTHPVPPALFGRDRFDTLLALTGSAGARELIRGGRHVVTAPAELIDVDTPADLARLRALVHSPEAITRATARRVNPD